MKHKHSHNGRQKAIGCLDRLLQESTEQEFIYGNLKLWLHENFREFFRYVIMPLYREPEVLPAEEEFAKLSPDEQVREMMRLTLGKDKPEHRESNQDALANRQKQLEASKDVEEEPTEQTSE